MAKLNETFDVAGVPEREEFTPVPPGVYTAMVVASEKKDTKAGGEMIVLELDIQDGEQAGRKLFERLNIVNSNQKAVDIAFRTLAEIVKAVGKTTIKDTEELHNKRISIEVRVDPPTPYVDKDGKQQEGKPQNSIKRFLPASGKVSADKTPAPAGVQAEAHVEKSSTPPWKRKSGPA
jgi:hypothetical protein